jgi:hypothetical protein
MTMTNKEEFEKQVDETLETLKMAEEAVQGEKLVWLIAVAIWAAIIILLVTI